jgi:hypothetical protein
VLFSEDWLASFINNNFEPAWESVRPVPLVHVDFGNGTVVTRTLNGNIATHVCTSDGLMLDTIPGIYTPLAYLQRLDQFRLLANYVEQEGKGGREARLRSYHRGQAEALKKNAIPPALVNVAPVTKARIESPLKAILVSGERAERRSANVSSNDAAFQKSKNRLGNDIALWDALSEDTRVNESIRRLQIHEKLAEAGPAPPERLTRWLYKNVLHADLDDPYLGLGGALFANYPFDDKVHQ